MATTHNHAIPGRCWIAVWDTLGERWFASEWLECNTISTVPNDTQYLIPLSELPADLASMTWQHLREVRSIADDGTKAYRWRRPLDQIIQALHDEAQGPAYQLAPQLVDGLRYEVDDGALHDLHHAAREALVPRPSYLRHADGVTVHEPAQVQRVARLVGDEVSLRHRALKGLSAALDAHVAAQTTTHSDGTEYRTDAQHAALEALTAQQLWREARMAAEAPSDTRLRDLAVWIEGTRAPFTVTFEPEVTEHVVEVRAGTTEVAFTAVPFNEGATVTRPASGALTAGQDNLFTVTVAAADKTSTRTYQITVRFSEPVGPLADET